MFFIPPDNEMSEDHVRFIELAKGLSSTWKSLDQKSRLNVFNSIREGYNLNVDFDAYSIKMDAMEADSKNY